MYHTCTPTSPIVYTRLMTVVGIYSNIQLVRTTHPLVLSLFPGHSQILSCNHGYEIKSWSDLGIRLPLFVVTFPGHYKHWTRDPRTGDPRTQILEGCVGL